jgi:hypothetical protein
LKISVFSTNFNFNLLKIIFASIFMALSIHICSSLLFGISHFLFVISLILIGIFIYFLILFLLGVLNKNDIRSIINLNF